MTAVPVERVRARSSRGLERRGWILPGKRYDHAERRRARLSVARFKWIAGGRRSGKTIDALDHILLGHGPIDPRTGMPMFRGALTADPRVDDPTYVIAGPTYGMLRKIWWEKLKRRLPPGLILSKSETDMIIRLVNGAVIMLIGLDDATRAEGIPIDGLVVDEMAYVKENAWRSSLRPALSTRGRPPGWAILQGKPSGKNHFHKGWHAAAGGKKKAHEAFTWRSSVVLAKKEIDQARVDLDEVTFRREYEASWETYTGSAYHSFGKHNLRPVEYSRDHPLAFAWDFGTSPGTVAVAQVHDIPATHCFYCGSEKPMAVVLGQSWACRSCGKVAVSAIPSLCIIGEAYELMGSKTRTLCEKLIHGWAGKSKPHAPLFLYGDPAGFSDSTRSRSSDWDEIVACLLPHFPNIRLNVAKAQPRQRDRINVLVRLCRSEAGLVRLFVNRDAAPHVVEDFENTVLKEDGSGELDKKAANGLYSHLTDGLGYLALWEFPLRPGVVDSEHVGT